VVVGATYALKIKKRIKEREVGPALVTTHEDNIFVLAFENSEENCRVFLQAF